MKLNQLMLCLCCDEVSLTATLCPICASRTVVELQKWIPPLSILDKPEDRKTRREKLLAECRELAKRMTELSNEAGLAEEPIGVCV